MINVSKAQNGTQHVRAHHPNDDQKAVDGGQRVYYTFITVSYYYTSYRSVTVRVFVK